MPERHALQERFLQSPSSMSDRELLIYLLTYTLSGACAEQTVDRLLKRFGSLNGILCADTELLLDTGISRPTAVLLRLVLTSQSVAAAYSYSTMPPLVTAQATADYLIRLFAGSANERLHMLMLDEKMRLKDIMLVSEGNVSCVELKARDMAARAMRKNAAFVIVAHNHPAGDPVPSEADMQSTELMCRAFEVLDIPMLEHILVAGHTWRPIMLSMDLVSPSCPPDYYPPELIRKITNMKRYPRNLWH